MGQCEFIPRSNELQSFVDHLANACVHLATLCEAAPAHEACEIFTGVATADTTRDYSDFERNWRDSLTDLMYDLFPTPGKVARDYVAKLHVLDEESRVLHPVRQALISHIVIHATKEWIDIYGDPYWELFEENAESGFIQQHSHSLEQYQLGVVMGWLGLVTSGVVAGKLKSASVIKHLPYIIRRTRFLSRMTRQVGAASALGPVASSLVPGGLGLAMAQDRIEFGLEPSPAHVVRFSEIYDQEIARADKEAAAAEMDSQIFRSIIVSGSALGTEWVVGSAGLKLAEHIENPRLRFIVSGLEPDGSFKFFKKALRWMRITPIAFLAATVAVPVAGGAYDTFREFRLTQKIEQAKNPIELAAALNEAYHFYTFNTQFTPAMIQFHKDFLTFASLDAETREGAQLDLVRGQLAAYMQPQNYPQYTGAHFIKMMICDAKANPTEEKLWGVSWHYLEQLRKFLYLHKKALTKMIKTLSDISFSDPELERQKQERIDSITHWLSDTVEVFNQLRRKPHQGVGKEPTHIEIKSYFERIATIERNNRNPDLASYYSCGR